MDRINLSQELSALADWLAPIATLFSPFGADSRLHWTGLAAFLVLGAAVYGFRWRGDKEGTSLIGFLFPLSLYRTASSWVDLKVFFAGRLLKPLLTAVTLPANAWIMAACATLVAGPQTALPVNDMGLGGVIAASLLVAVVFDFSYYVTHRLSHESPLLWPFHKLHHSAEVLTPITAKRNHPVFDLLRAVMGIAMTAPVAGVIFGFFGVVEFTEIFGLTLMIALMNVTGGALRHSHIWVDFGPVLDRIFISPAQHQIHHSLEPRHHDKNYGLTLAIWDWMFGTLYVPGEREALSFGVAERDGTPQPQVHNTLKEAYLVPFAEAADAARARDTKITQEPA